MTNLPSALHDRIDELSDTESIRLLRIVVQGVDAEPPASLQDLRPALAQKSTVKASSASAGEGEVARAALHVLAETPPHGERIQAVLDAPDLQTFDLGATVAIITAAVIVLQLNVEFERDGTGAWRFQLAKPTASEELIQSLIDALNLFRGI
jgi:hypothetical protein